MLFYWADALAPTTPEREILFHLISVPPPRPETTQLLALEDDGFESWGTATGYYLVYGTSTLVLDVRRGKGIGCFTPGFWRRPLIQQRRFLLLLVMILLHGRGCYVLHANGITWGQSSLLIVGSSGSGKTTLTLGLMQAGGFCLGDDALLLRMTNPHVRAYTLRRSFGCDAQTVTHFPQLANAFATAPVLNHSKRLLNLEKLWPDRFDFDCAPSLIAFPTVANTAHSRLTPLSPTQTLCALLKQSRLMDQAMTRHQLAVLKHLARQARGFQLHSGRDVYAEPERVATLLRAALQEGSA